MRAAGETGPSFWKYGDQTPPPKPPEPPPAPTGETLYGRPVAGPYSKYTPGQSPKYVSPTDYMGSVLREENTPAGFEQWLKEQGYNEDNRDILQGKLQEKLRKAEEAKAAEAQKVKKENVDLKERPFTPVKPGPVKPPGAKPPDVKPDEVKPEPEVKPVEVKPVEVKPEEKPVEPEVKPVEPETKPVETETVKHPDDTLYNNVIKKAAENGYVSNELIQKWSKNWADKPAGWGRAKRIMERLESEKLLGDRHPNRGQKFLGEKAPGEKITSSELADSAEEDPATTVAREIARGLSSKEFPREDVGGGQNLLKMYAQDAHRRLIGGDIPDDVYESVKGKVAELKTKKLAEERDIAKRREDLPFGSEELPGRPFTKKELAEEVEKRDERTKTTEAEISSKKKNVLLSTLQSVGVPNADIERMRSDWTIEQVMEFNNKLLSSGENWGEVLKGAFGGKKPVETKTEGPGKVEPPVKDPEIRVLQNRSRGLIKELKMSDADRKALMKEKFGVESSTKLSTAQLQELVNHLVKLKAGK